MTSTARKRVNSIGGKVDLATKAGDETSKCWISTHKIEVQPSRTKGMCRDFHPLVLKCAKRRYFIPAVGKPRGFLHRSRDARRSTLNRSLWSKPHLWPCNFRIVTRWPLREPPLSWSFGKGYPQWIDVPNSHWLVDENRGVCFTPLRDIIDPERII